MMIEPKLMDYDGYWVGLIDRTFVDSGRFSNRISIVEGRRFIIHVKRKSEWVGSHCMLYDKKVTFEEILDFLRESNNQLDQQVFGWFLFHLSEFI